MLWVGGNGIHYLLRRNQKTHPVRSYLDLVAPVLAHLATIPRSVFIGPTPVDRAVFLDPPKHDWRQFDDTLSPRPRRQRQSRRMTQLTITT